MRRMGICQKCGEYKIVRDHHYKGYGINEVVPYCYSCDYKAHIKNRREGKCKLSPVESFRLSRNSYQKRSTKTFKLSHNTIGRNVRLMEVLRLNLNTGCINFGSCFIGTNNKKLKIIDENKRGVENETFK